MEKNAPKVIFARAVWKADTGKTRMRTRVKREAPREDGTRATTTHPAGIKGAQRETHQETPTSSTDALHIGLRVAKGSGSAA